jgi:hypothetical protein
MICSQMDLRNTLLTRLQLISHRQSEIAGFASQLQQVSSEQQRQSQRMNELLHMHRIPSAWGATLIEIVRRRSYEKVRSDICYAL